MKRGRLLIVTMAALLLSACSETKYVPEGQYLLDRVKVRNPFHVRSCSVYSCVEAGLFRRALTRCSVKR